MIVLDENQDLDPTDVIMTLRKRKSMAAIIIHHVATEIVLNPFYEPNHCGLPMNGYRFTIELISLLEELIRLRDRVRNLFRKDKTPIMDNVKMVARPMLDYPGGIKHENKERITEDRKNNQGMQD